MGITNNAEAFLSGGPKHECPLHGIKKYCHYANGDWGFSAVLHIPHNQ